MGSQSGNATTFRKGLEAVTRGQGSEMRKRNHAWTSRREARDGIQESILKARMVEEQTNAETQYLANLIRTRTPVIVRLVNGDSMNGWIEYYDRSFIRLTRAGEANVFIFKDQIEYIREDR